MKLSEWIRGLEEGKVGKADWPDGYSLFRIKTTLQSYAHASKTWKASEDRLSSFVGVDLSLQDPEPDVYEKAYDGLLSVQIPQEQFPRQAAIRVLKKHFVPRLDSLTIPREK